MCCFCKKPMPYSPQNWGYPPTCDCVKPSKNQCLCGGYLQNGWGKYYSCPNCISGAKVYQPCGCKCRCGTTKPKCQQKCDNSSLLKIKLEGIIKFC